MDHNDELVKELRALLDTGLTEKAVARAVKGIKDALIDAHSDLEYDLKSNLSYNLSAWVVRMAADAINAMLKGDEESMRKHLSCCEHNYTGRDGYHPVIGGTLFVSGPIALRKQIVEAYPELLKDERVLDLEDQVRSLVEQVNKLTQANERLYERIGGRY